MSNDKLRLELTSLERKIKILLNEHARLKEDFEKVSAEKAELEERLTQKESKLENFQNQMKISKIVESMLVNNGDSEELKDVIEDYIKEIDKCIAHLGEA